MKLVIFLCIFLLTSCATSLKKNASTLKQAKQSLKYNQYKKIFKRFGVTPLKYEQENKVEFSFKEGAFVKIAKNNNTLAKVFKLKVKKGSCINLHFRNYLIAVYGGPSGVKQAGVIIPQIEMKHTRKEKIVLSRKLEHIPPTAFEAWFVSKYGKFDTSYRSKRIKKSGTLYIFVYPDASNPMQPINVTAPKTELTMNANKSINARRVNLGIYKVPEGELTLIPRRVKCDADDQ